MLRWMVTSHGYVRVQQHQHHHHQQVQHRVKRYACINTADNAAHQSCLMKPSVTSRRPPSRCRHGSSRHRAAKRASHHKSSNTHTHTHTPSELLKVALVACVSAWLCMLLRVSFASLFKRRGNRSQQPDCFCFSSYSNVC